MEKMEIIENIVIKIDRKEVFRFLGYKKGTNDSSFQKIRGIIDEEIEDVYPLLENKGIYNLLPVKSLSEQGIVLTGQEGYRFSVNKRVIKLLSNAEYLLFSLITIGQKVESMVKKRFQENQCLNAMVLDAIGTVAVKSVAQWLNHHLEEMGVNSGLRFSRYFEPGCNDWDIREQEKVFAILQPERIGVTLNSSYMMEPAKSMSWIRGAGCNLINFYQDESSCQYCQNKNCPFRVE